MNIHDIVTGIDLKIEVTKSNYPDCVVITVGNIGYRMHKDFAKALFKSLLKKVEEFS